MLHLLTGRYRREAFSEALWEQVPKGIRAVAGESIDGLFEEPLDDLARVLVRLAPREFNAKPG